MACLTLLGLFIAVLSFCFLLFILFEQMFLIRWFYSTVDYISDWWDSLFHSNWYGLGFHCWYSLLPCHLILKQIQFYHPFGWEQDSTQKHDGL